jgi:hypothetical protein
MVMPTVVPHGRPTVNPGTVPGSRSSGGDVVVVVRGKVVAACVGSEPVAVAAVLVGNADRPVTEVVDGSLPRLTK